MFATAARTWTWSDVFLAARLWGQWDAVLAATRDADAPEPAVKQAGRDWRVARRLIAGDELKAWLAERRLTVADWNAYIAPGDRASATRAPRRAPTLLWAEGACSGIWDAVADRLASCAAAWEDGGRPAARRPPPPEWFGRMPSAADAAEIGIDAGSVAGAQRGAVGGRVGAGRARSRGRGLRGRRPARSHRTTSTGCASTATGSRRATRTSRARPPCSRASTGWPWTRSPGAPACRSSRGGSTSATSTRRSSPR